MIQVSWSLVFGLQELNYSTDGSTGEGERLQNVNSSRQPLHSYKKFQRLISVYISNLCISVFLHIYANMRMCHKSNIYCIYICVCVHKHLNLIRKDINTFKNNLSTTRK